METRPQNNAPPQQTDDNGQPHPVIPNQAYRQIAERHSAANGGSLVIKSRGALQPP